MKYYLLSDIHSFYSEMKEALDEAGYDPKNKNHTLVILGDIFDRGSETIKVYNYLKRIPKSRRILIKGNHEELYDMLLDKHYPEGHDFSNGTVNTFCQIAQSLKGSADKIICDPDYYRQSYHYKSGMFRDTEWFDEQAGTEWQKVKGKVKDSEITKWLSSSEWKDYYEINDKFICVHSFIPTMIKQSLVDEIGIYAYMSENPAHYDFDPNWRNSKTEAWNSARWGSPWAYYQEGLFKAEEDKGKTLVCGHWHTSDFFKHLKNITSQNDVMRDIYFSKGLIGLDGGVSYNSYYQTYYHPQNVMIIDENNVCFDKSGKMLKELDKM